VKSDVAQKGSVGVFAGTGLYRYLSAAMFSDWGCTTKSNDIGMY
jgi:hypothetical protein